MEPALAGPDRWLLSYSDLLTLLFSLFVVLFASAHVTPKVVPRVAAKPAPIIAPIPVIPPNQDLTKLQSILSERLSEVLTSGKVEMTMESRGLVLQLRDASFFLSGDDQIRPECYTTIGDIATAIQPLNNLISIEGHADAAVMHGSRFKDNWELSAARGLSVIRYMTQMLGIPPERLSAAAYSDTRPRADNDSEAGRAQNRRVDIVIHREAEQLLTAK